MPDKRSHRGPHPADGEMFAPSAWTSLRRAVADLSWLLTHGYAEKSALKLVGDRFSLTERQRLAVMRCACSDEALARRHRHEIDATSAARNTLLLDGYNVLTTIEAALSRGVLLQARDGCYRDMASMHGSYRKVQETIPAIKMAGELLAKLHIATCTWYLDRPVSNSGRLKTLIQHVTDEHGWNWDVQVVPDPDRILCETNHIVASADSVILDRCDHWFNFARLVVETFVRDAYVVDLSRSGT